MVLSTIRSLKMQIQSKSVLECLNTILVTKVKTTCTQVERVVQGMKMWNKSKSISQQHPLEFKIEKYDQLKYINVLEFVSNPSHNDSKVESKPNVTNTSQDYFLVNQAKKITKDTRSNSETFKLRSTDQFVVTNRLSNSKQDSLSPNKSKYLDSNFKNVSVAQAERANYKKQGYSGIAPHGGSIERVNNEERLNFMSEANMSKIDARSVFRTREKSIDLSMKCNQAGSFQQNVMTNKLMETNNLSKYLTGFIGNKDFRTTEERELDKCTFNPKFYPNHKRYKSINSKLSPYIKGDYIELAKNSKNYHSITCSQGFKTQNPLGIILILNST